jgi:hypothetical protein
MNTDTTDTDTTDTTDTTGTTGTGSAVTITEIAEFLQQLRALSWSSAAADTGLARRDTTAERAAFLARKADLFARIAAQHPDLAPPPTAPPPTTQPDGGRA